MMENELITAVRSGDTQRVRRLIGADPTLAARVDENRVPVILVAIYYGHREIAQLLSAKASTLSIHEAAALGDLQTIRALGRWPDTLVSYSPDGWTPLHLAAAFGGVDAVRALLEMGADVHQRSRNPTSNTALHACAAISRSPEIVGLLLDHGADINATQAGGFTALHAAAFSGTETLARFLLEHGADISLKTVDGQTAADLAREKGHDSLAALISSADNPSQSWP